jgi:drug/metabolite transporter (DMT)-like permease
MMMLIPLSAAESGWSALADASLDEWFAIAYLAAFGTVVAFVLFYMGVRRIGASRTTAFALLVPVFGVLSSVLILDEKLTVSTLVGGLIVIGGLWLVQRKSASEPVEASRIPPRALQID